MFYLNLRVVTKQKLIVDTERKTTTKENYQITEEDIKRGSKEQKIYKTENYEQNGNSKSLPMNNFFNCKWTEFSSQKIQWVNKLKKKIQ